MRTFTEKERKALVTALRTFVRDMSGKRMEMKRATKALDSSLDGGIDLDTLFNPQNYLRLKALIDEPTVEDYIEAILEYRIDARKLTEEPDWNINGFVNVAHVYHDFYCSFDPKGGVWNTPAALLNLTKAIAEHSLGAILSEELLSAVSAAGKMTVYTYITSILSGDFTVSDEPTQEEQTRAGERVVFAETTGTDPVEDFAHESEAESETVSDDGGDTNPVVNRFLKRLTDGTAEENDDLYPDDEPEEEEAEDEDESVYAAEYEQEYDPAVNYCVRPNPYLIKREAVQTGLQELTLMEVNGLASTMDDGAHLKLTEITDNLTLGRFDASRENVEVKQTHMYLSSMLLQRFIDCCRMNGVDMNEETASGYDILKIEWDLRNPRVRTFYKLRELIMQKGENDPDLMKAIPELERVFDAENN